METITADYPTTSTEAERDIKIVTTKQRRCQVIKISIMAVLTILSLTFFLSDVVITVKNVNRLQELKKNIKRHLEVSSNIKLLQIKRNNMSKTWLNQSIKQQVQFTVSSLRGKETNTKDFLVNNSQSLDDAHYMAAYAMIVKSMKEFETEKLLGAAYLCFGKSLTSQFQTIPLKKVRGEAFLEAARLLSPTVNDNYLSFKQEMSNSLWLARLEVKRQQFSLKPPNISDTACAFEWWTLTSKYSNLLVHLRNEEAQRILLTVEEIIRKITLLLILRSVFVCVVLIILPFFIISLVKVQNEFYKYAGSLHHEVVLEKSRTEFLLSENSRHMAGMAERWKQYSQQFGNAENRDNQTLQGSIKECWTDKQ